MPGSTLKRLRANNLAGVSHAISKRSLAQINRHVSQLWHIDPTLFVLCRSKCYRKNRRTRDGKSYNV
jgi:hypothetical protein